MKLGGSVRYHLSDILEWEDAHVVRRGSEEDAEVA